ncbi:hypothetical protein MPTK1_5g06400 [Marchantia polymorpha subsp. ruderalis]|uniref:RRM domain-containing protein n=2 Tax=Marchantia polymorpha TaxID=3197 RepID=A0AAF6BFJ9_MARPO|nr:hypothetical protein MARPO_0189s0014 [Marchantia polymorpha]BBN10783.1 hypothetical protein Mp_5g06400 [Marchantia polymorpha subsp. ruderalis]|eukprot:PTQ27641.1 hypothetical protein MARPO_0189s0014 [Marchantia polymorpha]
MFVSAGRKPSAMDPELPADAKESTSIRVEVRNIPNALVEEDLMLYFESKFEANCITVCRLYRKPGLEFSRGVGNVIFKDIHVAREAVRLSEAGLLELYGRKLDLKFLAERNRTTLKADSRVILQDCVVHIGSMKAHEIMLSYAQYRSPSALEVDKERQTVSLYFSSQNKQNQFKLEFRAHDNFRLRVLHHDRSRTKELKGFLIQEKVRC